MFLIEVIPIAKSVRVSTLSYFSLKEIQPGTLVSVPVRKKEHKAVVVAIRKLRDIKAEIKSADFQLRNVLNIYQEHLFSSEFFNMAVDCASFYAVEIGVMLDTLLLPTVTKRFEQFSKQTRKNIDVVQTEISSGKHVLQQSYTDRLRYYKLRSREVLAHNKSLVIICPTIEACKTLYQHISKGIDDRCYVLHSGHTIKKLQTIHDGIKEDTTSCIIIATPRFLSWAPPSTTEFIIEQSSSDHYKHIVHPYIDFRYAIEKLADYYRATCTRADTIIDISTWHNIEDGTYILQEPSRKKVIDPGQLNLLQFHVGNEKQTEEERIRELKHQSSGFHPLHYQALEVVKQGIQENKKIVIHVPKKGLARHMVCQDCGRLAMCDESQRPYSLYHKNNPKTGKKEAVYVCSTTAQQIPAFDVCQTCKGIRLKPMGITTGSIAKALEKDIPSSCIHIVDSNHCIKKSDQKKLLERWNSEQAMVVVGTNMVLSLLDTWDESIMVSTHTLFSLMGYANEEKIVHLISAIQERCSGTTYIQDRTQQLGTLSILNNGLYEPFAKEQLAIRKQLNFPPYARLIKVSIPVKRTYLKQYYRDVKHTLIEYQPEILIRPYRKDTVQLIVIIKLANCQWNFKYQDPKLSAFIQSQERTTRYEIDPDILQ